MSRQLDLRMSDELADRLERLARRLGRPMSQVLELVGAPALEAAEADAELEADALGAWEQYQLTGEQVRQCERDRLFSDASAHAESVGSTRRP